MTTTRPGPVIRRSVAAMLLELPLSILDELKLRSRKEGHSTFYDAEQIMGLIELRKYWLKHPSR